MTSKSESLNEPEWPTQMQIDHAEIARLRGLIKAALDDCCDCHGKGTVTAWTGNVELNGQIVRGNPAGGKGIFAEYQCANCEDLRKILVPGLQAETADEFPPTEAAMIRDNGDPR